MGSQSTSSRNNKIKMKSRLRYKKGLTLIEIVIVLAILTLLLSIGLVVNLNYLKNDLLRAEQKTIISVLQKARSKSLNNLFGVPYGFCYIAPNYVIFRDTPGTRCVTGVSSNILTPANIKIAGNSGTLFPGTVIFSQLSGTTTAASIHITDGIKSADITLNYEGTIIW